MAEIRLSGINKVYPGGTHAVHDVDLHIADGEFMIMVGPSGCAKSTILRMIAGLEVPTTGTIEIGGRVVNDVAPKDRDIAMVFQSYALYPHMTVRENMAFGLKLRKMPQGEIDQRVAEAARILGLEQLLDRLPKAMSGGQRQRVAMGRAIVREPQAFLMDEPLSNLDAKLRVQMRTEIAKLHQRLSTTTVYVTHDQVEAMTLGQRICILRKGVVQQVDTPFQVYQNPANVFVGGFIGSPGMNFMNGHLLLHDGMVHLQLGDRHLPLPASVSSRLPSSVDLHGRGVVVGIRPEHLAMSTDADPNALPVQVELTEAMGAEVYAYFTASVTAPDLSALSDTQATASTFVARLGAGAEANGGEQIWLRPDLAEVHLFDPTSQLTLLAPAVEADVRARQAGDAIAIAGGTAIRPAAPVAMPGQAPAAVTASVVQPVIHLHQTITGIDQPVIGTIEPADPQRIASVFDQQVAAPVQLHAMPAPAALAGTGTAPTAPHPRPTFSTTVDPAPHAAPAVGASTPDDIVEPHAPTHAPSPEAVTSDGASTEEQPAASSSAPEAPARPRGFAPRLIGAAAGAASHPAAGTQHGELARASDEPGGKQSVGRIELADHELDVAIARIDEIDATPAAHEFAPATTIARPSGFLDALARIRSTQPDSAGN
jgi:multiple sugar transport system ATP-binding protein